MTSMINANSNNRILFPQARDVLGVTSTVVGAVLQRAHVDMVRHFIIHQSINQRPFAKQSAFENPNHR